MITLILIYQTMNNVHIYYHAHYQHQSIHIHIHYGKQCGILYSIN